MDATKTSMPWMAPAKAAVACGIGVSVRPADMLHAEFRPEVEQFRYSSNGQGMGSEGVAVI